MRVARIVAVLLTVVALWLASRLELSNDLTTLFPRTPAAEALARVTRAFGGGDVALVLVRGDDPASVERAAEAAAEELRACASVAGAITSAPPPAAIDPTEAWRFAGPVARARLARAVTEEGMRERLRETRALLLAPGAADVAETIARDPLRLAMIPWQDRIEIAAGVHGSAGDPAGAFVSADGRARLVVVEPRGRAFDAGEAARFTDEAEAALERVTTREAGVTLDLTGGHVVARQTEALVRSDLVRSGALSAVLASLVFALTFRRVRALVAVLPPLAIGTLWTTALAALAYPRLSAVATGFAAVVIGVGVDTGVHVYGRLLRARREGMSPGSAAVVARRETWRPTLGAALAAGGAFGCLALSDVEGMRQLGVLCAAGEVLTALAILVVVPEVGALLERGAPPALPRASWIVALTRTRGRAAAAIAAVASVLAVAAWLGPPPIERGVATLSARELPALATYDAIYATFGGTRGQLVVVSADRDPARARARADAVAEAAERLAERGTIAGFDALASLAPSPELQRARLAERDELDLPSRRGMLSHALAEEGFAVEELAPAIEAFAHPKGDPADVLASEDVALTWLRRRHLADEGGETLAVTYVRVAPAPGADEAARAALRGADPDAVITGFADLERGLARTLAQDLPRVLAGALGVVALVLGASLRRPSRVALAVSVLAVEIALVLVLSRICAVRWHVYDALVLPVLLGITLDEVLFLLEAAERSGSIEQAIAEQAPLGTATALTTAAGFGALVVCRFGGLVDVGKVGALGSTAGVLVAFVVIPAAHRLTKRAAVTTP
ncbi:MAG: MMPL family transporter [Labilithrix sp.]|nr:MMPL family transporter [Labilithrix sp.]MCW5835532.1 MMPL family transporter [Labilithrix sp.]